MLSRGIESEFVDNIWTMRYQPCPYVVPALSPHGTQSVPTWYQPCTHVVPTLYPRGTRSVPTWYQPCPHVVPWYQLCTHVVPNLYQPGTNPVPTWYQPCTHVVPNQHPGGTKSAPRWYQICVLTSVVARPLPKGTTNVPFVVWSKNKICPLPVLCLLITFTM